jgi:hypothetical protein
MLARAEEELNAKERYIEHKKRIVLYDHLADEPSSPSETESSDSDDMEHTRERQDSVSSPSESSVATPNETPAAFTKQTTDSAEPIAVEKPQLHLLLPGSPMDTGSIHPSPAPKLQASLVALADFTYDRYSMILDTPKPMASPTETVSTPDLEFDDYTPSPVEVATPISISSKVRPLVISISPRSNKKRRTITAQSPLSQTRSQSPPPPPPRSARRLSQSSTKSGFLASEASLMQVPDLPDNASAKIAHASRDSVAWSIKSRDEKRPMHRQSSQPLLTAIKTSHARMSSIKSLIRSPVHQTSSSISSSRPESRSCRTPTSAADVMDDNIQPFETVPANLYDAPKPRPHTSHRPYQPSISSTKSRQLSVTALPMVPSVPEPPQTADDAASQKSGSMRRKKSFSNLRKRSESIGQAIKTVATKTMSNAGHTPKLSQQFPTLKRETTFPPPIPIVPASKSHQTKPSVELSAFPTPPLPSPSPILGGRNRKSVASYSMFPSTPKLGPDRKSSIGLGLGLKV